MSDRDREIITNLRRAYEAFSRAHFDTAIGLAHPEIEFVPPGGQSSLRGADALRAWMEPDAIEEQRIEPREFRVKGNKALVRQHTWEEVNLVSKTVMSGRFGRAYCHVTMFRQHHRARMPTQHPQRTAQDRLTDKGLEQFPASSC